MDKLDVVNEQDKVIGQAFEDEIYEKKLIHRIVHVLIFNSKGEMALQMRSKFKPFCPQHWSTAVGGRVNAGEDYKTAAKREFMEELNTACDMEFLAKEIYIDQAKNHKKFLTIFKTVYDGEFKINLQEVERLEFLPLPKINQMIARGEKFHPELLFLLKKHYSN